MDNPELRIGNMYIRVDGDVIELFDQVILGSLRVPLAWFGVQVRPGRHDKVQLNFGVASPIGALMYGQSVGVLAGPWGISVDADEESRCRDFFAGVAPLAGRQVES